VVEVLVVVVLMGIVATVITAATTIILRTQGPTNERVNETRSLHGLNTWIGQDASSTAPGDFDLAGAATTSCTTGDPGTNLVRMTWTEDTGSAVTYMASYRFVDRGGEGFRIERHSCSGAGAGPYGNGVIQNLTGELSATPPVVTPRNGPLGTIGVRIEVFAASGESIFVDGDSRNPAETLPPTTTTSTTTTTTTTTTTLPATCVLVEPPGIVAAPNPIANQGSGRLVSDVTVTIQVTAASTCSDLRLRYDRGIGGLQYEAFTGSHPNYSLTLERDSSQLWTDGFHPLDVTEGPSLPVINTGSYALEVL
jgi:hypothetical protein